MAETDDDARSYESAPDAEPTRAQYRIRMDGPVPVVEVDGELDYSNADTLTTCLSVFERGESVVVDLTRLTFIDSSGIGAFAQAHARGVKISARGAHDEVRKALDLCGLAVLFAQDN